MHGSEEEERLGRRGLGTISHFEEFLSTLKLIVEYVLVFHEGVPLWQFNPLEDSLCVPGCHPPAPEADMDSRPPLAFLQVQHQREAHHAPRVPWGRRGAPTPSGTSPSRGC